MGKMLAVFLVGILLLIYTCREKRLTTIAEYVEKDGIELYLNIIKMTLPKSVQQILQQ